MGLVFFTTIFAPGCGPALKQEDLGTVIHEVPHVPGSEKPFPVPGVDENTGTPPERPK